MNSSSINHPGRVFVQLRVQALSWRLSPYRRRYCVPFDAVLCSLNYSPVCRVLSVPNSNIVTTNKKTDLCAIISSVLTRSRKRTFVSKNTSHRSDIWEDPLQQYFCDGLTHWGRDQIDAISQTTFLNAFSRMKMNEFRLGFHWSLFLRFESTIFQHWFR